MKTIELARIAPKGSRQHDHTKRARAVGTRASIERVLGEAHSEGDGSQTTAEWFLVTDHGSVTVYNHCSLGDEEYGIDAANDAAALLAVTYLKTNKLEAYCLGGPL